MAIKQRFTYFFAGTDIDTDIWRKYQHNGTTTFGMVNAVDGGYSLDTTAGGIGYIDFDDGTTLFSQYSNTASVFLTTARRVDTDGSGIEIGMAGERADNANNAVFWSNSASQTFTRLRTGHNTASTFIETTTAIHTNFSNIKITTGASNVVLLEDGVTQTTKSTNLPTAGMSPKWRNIGGATLTTESQCRVMEAFNT